MKNFLEKFVFGVVYVITIGSSIRMYADMVFN